MEKDWLPFQSSKATEIYPGLIIGGLRNLEDILRMKPDILVPLDHLPGDIWETGYRGEILYCPIKDRNILPRDVLDSIVNIICNLLLQGKRVAIFCIGGHGRTGYITACVLCLLGIRDPISHLRKNYSILAVETEEQEDEVQEYCKKNSASNREREGNDEALL